MSAPVLAQDGRITIPGIPRGLGKSLYRFVEQCKAADTSQESVAALVAWPTGWEPVHEWVSEVQSAPLNNVVGGDAVDGAAFAIDREELRGVLKQVIEQRGEVANKVVADNSWENHLWVTVAEEVATARWEENVDDCCSTSNFSMQNFIEQYIEEQAEMLKTEFAGTRTWRDKSLHHGDGSMDWTKLTAWEYLMATGVSALCGIAHSHPGGNPGLSPQDLLGSRAVDSWRKAFEVRFPDKGQSEDSAVETRLGTGNWIFAFDWFRRAQALKKDPEAASVLGALVRYDARGIRGQWTGAY